MKHSIESIVSTKGLPLFSHRSMAPVLRRLGFGLGSNRVAATASGLWTRAINGMDSDCFAPIELFPGLITDYFNQPELNKPIRSGEHFTVQPT